MKRKPRIDPTKHGAEMAARRARQRARGEHLQPTTFATDFRTRQAQARLVCARVIVTTRPTAHPRQDRLRIHSHIRRLETITPRQVRSLGALFSVKPIEGEKLTLERIRAEIRLRFPKASAVPTPEPWYGFKHWSKARFDRAFPDPEAPAAVPA